MSADAKVWWKSKTLWLNAAVALIAGIEAKFSLLQGTIPADWYQPALFLVGLANIALRFVTTQAVTVRK